MSTFRDYSVFNNSILLGPNITTSNDYIVSGDIISNGINSSRYSSTNTSTGIWNPYMISDFIVFDFSNIETITKNGNGISSIIDSGKRGFTLSQSTQSGQPTITEYAFGSASALTLETGKSMSATSLGLANGGATFFMVEKNMVGAVGSAPFSFTSGPNNGIVFQSNYGLQPYTPLSSYPFNSSTGRMHLYYRSNTGSGSYCYLNDVLCSSDDNSTGTYGNFVVGMRYVGSYYCTSGLIGTIIIIPRVLTTIERNKLFGWGAWRFNLQSSLQSNHTYKYYPPSI